MNFLEQVEQIAEVKHFFCEVQGATPLTWNKQLSEEDKAGKKRTPEEVERDLWRFKLHVRSDLGVFHPADGLIKALIAGAKRWGAGIPSKKGTRYNTQLQGSVTMVSDFIVLTPDGKRLNRDSPEIKDYPRHVTRKDGQQIFVVTPIIYDWTGRFAMTVHDPAFSGVVLATIIKYAGLYNGIGAWWKKYGRFEPTLFEEGGSDVYTRL
ncbi:MAG: hypothetical protein WC654_03740 [Patescibacteria group bacterium]